MRIHGYNPTTGEFTDQADYPSPIIAAQWEAAGRVLVEYSGLDINRANYNYKGGVLTLKIEVSITVDKASIDADGVDQAVVTVSVAGEEPPASIDLLVAGTLETVNLTGGQGALDPITAETPCTVQVELADTITYRGEPVEIEAVDNA